MVHILRIGSVIFDIDRGGFYVIDEYLGNSFFRCCFYVDYDIERGSYPVDSNVFLSYSDISRIFRKYSSVGEHFIFFVG